MWKLELGTIHFSSFSRMLTLNLVPVKVIVTIFHLSSFRLKNLIPLALSLNVANVGKSCNFIKREYLKCVSYIHGTHVLRWSFSNENKNNKHIRPCILNNLASSKVPTEFCHVCHLRNSTDIYHLIQHYFSLISFVTYLAQTTLSFFIFFRSTLFSDR